MLWIVFTNCCSIMQSLTKIWGPYVISLITLNVNVWNHNIISIYLSILMFWRPKRDKGRQISHWVLCAISAHLPWWQGCFSLSHSTGESATTPLTHLPMDKMAAIYQAIFSDRYSWMKSFKISLKFVPKGLIDNNQTLVYIMAWRRIGNKPLSEPMPTRFTDAFIRH